MQTMRKGLNIFSKVGGASACQLEFLVQLEHRARNLRIASFQFDGEQRDPLGDVIMQFSGNPCAFFLMSLNQPAAYAANNFLGLLSIGDVHARSDEAGKTGVGIEPRHARVEYPTVLSITT